jgi:hypothetical protein
MKKNILLCTMLFFSILSGSQSIVIGTGIDNTNDNEHDPISGLYKSFKYQVVYAAAELVATSIFPNDEITDFGFSISQDYAGGNLNGYEIKMGHTLAVTSAPHDAATTSVVKNAFNYDPTTTAVGVFDMITPLPSEGPENDDCSNAIALTVNSDYACDAFTSGTTIGATASAQDDDVFGTPNNDVWYSFEATATAHKVSLLNVENQGGGTSSDISMGIGFYDATNGCEALPRRITTLMQTTNVENLVPGRTYF